MGEFAGALAGFGMLLLIAALVTAFLRQIGALGEDSLRALGRTAAAALGAGCVYWLLGALVYQVVYGNLQSPADIGQIFRGAYIRQMISALEEPSFVGPLSWLFAVIGHALGKVLFGRYLLAGMALALGMTAAALVFLRAALLLVCQGEAAEDAVFLLLCLPGAVYFFLPGFAPLALLLAAAALWLLAGRFKCKWRVVSLNQGAYLTLLSLSATLSAAVTAALALA